MSPEQLGRMVQKLGDLGFLMPDEDTEHRLAAILADCEPYACCGGCVCEGHVLETCTAEDS